MTITSSMNPPPISIEAALKDTCSSYQEHAKVHAAKLCRIYVDLGLEQEQQAQELNVACGKALWAAQAIWTEEVQQAESKRAALQEQVDSILREITATQAQLGLAEQELLKDAAFPNIKAAVDYANELLAIWRKRKTERQLEADAVQSTNTLLRQRLGLPQPLAKVDLTPAGLDFAHLEQGRLLGEQDRRLALLHDEMARLRHVTAELLGEDTARAAGEVHPSLRHYSFPDSVPASETAAYQTQLGLVDLSLTTLEGLANKTRDMHVIKAERETQLQQLEDVLVSLWESAGIHPSAPERAVFVTAMVGPHRLHADNLEKVLAEVRRLEECRTQAMRDLTLSKAREYVAVCHATHIPCPPLEQILADLTKKPADVSTGSQASHQSNNPGQISECLAKVVRQLSEVVAESERRKQMVTSIVDLEQALVEIKWLQDEYENDVNRFKGRDANARLNRSIRAQKHREMLPQMLDKLQRMLESWALTEGAPFLFDGHDYQESLRTHQQECAVLLEQEREKALLRSTQKQQKKPCSTPAGKAGITPAKGLPNTPGLYKGGVSMACVTPVPSAARGTAPRRPGQWGAPTATLAHSMQITPEDLKRAAARTKTRTPTGSRPQTAQGTPGSASLRSSRAPSPPVELLNLMSESSMPSLSFKAGNPADDMRFKDLDVHMHTDQGSKTNVSNRVSRIPKFNA